MTVLALFDGVDVALSIADGMLKLEVRVDGLRLSGDFDLLEHHRQDIDAPRIAGGGAYIVNNGAFIGYGLRESFRDYDTSCHGDVLMNSDGSVHIRLTDVVVLAGRVAVASAASAAVVAETRLQPRRSIVYTSSNGQKILAGSDVDQMHVHSPVDDPLFEGRHPVLRSVVKRSIANGARRRLDIEEVAAMVPRTAISHVLPISLWQLRALGGTQRGACALARSLSFESSVVRPYDIEIEPFLEQYWAVWLAEFHDRAQRQDELAAGVLSRRDRNSDHTDWLNAQGLLLDGKPPSHEDYW